LVVEKANEIISIKQCPAGHQWLMPVMLATQEAEISNIKF
jgi:hypothetical protein